MNNRYLNQAIYDDLKDRMVLLGGPRQVGKTTLAKELLTAPNRYYFNWDNDQDRKKLIQAQWPSEKGLLILDEIHKYSRWKNWVKGQYDKHHHHFQFLVTGSAKLNIFRHHGDSLFGRYHYYCLHPFSYQELIENGKPPNLNESSIGTPLQFHSKTNTHCLESLFNFGGFPEPFLKQSNRFLRRWHNERINLLVKEDIRNLEDVKDLGLMLLFAQALATRAGSMLSLNALREDLLVSHNAVSRWINLLEMVYYCFRIYPYHFNALKSLKKEPKLFLWDWSEIEDDGPKFENMIASHLLKYVHFIRDYFGITCTLNYIRTRDKKELDFLISIKNKPWFGVECKLSNQNISQQLHYFKKTLNIPTLYQVLKKPNIDFIQNDIHVLSADKFLSALI